MWSQRSIVDYSLQRRATLRSLFGGGAHPSDVCDADPYLLRAAKFHGEAARARLPGVPAEPLTHVTYVFGDELGQYAGRVRRSAELELMAREHAEFRVYVVEVCQGCGWNYLTLSYVLGDGVPRRASSRRRSAVEDR